MIGGEWPGVSRPPAVWHTGPGIKLRQGDQVWFVKARDWPHYRVRRGYFVTLIHERRPERVARLVTQQRYWRRGQLTAGPQVEVPLARIFLSEQLANAECYVLYRFARDQPPPGPRTRVEEPRSRRFNP